MTFDVKYLVSTIRFCAMALILRSSVLKSACNTQKNVRSRNFLGFSNFNRWLRRGTLPPSSSRPEQRCSQPPANLQRSSRRAAAGRAQLLAKERTAILEYVKFSEFFPRLKPTRPRLKPPGARLKPADISLKLVKNLANFERNFVKFCEISVKM